MDLESCGWELSVRLLQQYVAHPDEGTVPQTGASFFTGQGGEPPVLHEYR